MGNLAKGGEIISSDFVQECAIYANPLVRVKLKRQPVLLGSSVSLFLSVIIGWMRQLLEDDVSYRRAVNDGRFYCLACAKNAQTLLLRSWRMEFRARLEMVARELAVFTGLRLLIRIFSRNRPAWGWKSRG